MAKYSAGPLNDFGDWFADRMGHPAPDYTFDPQGTLANSTWQKIQQGGPNGFDFSNPAWQQYMATPMDIDTGPDHYDLPPTTFLGVTRPHYDLPPTTFLGLNGSQENQLPPDYTLDPTTFLGLYDNPKPNRKRALDRLRASMAQTVAPIDSVLNLPDPPEVSANIGPNKRR
jgi:hypothetical protein